MSAVDRVPKADIHCHLEGTASAGLVRELAAKNGVALDPALFGPDGDYVWRDFPTFLKAYDAAARAICTPEDYARVMFEHLRGTAAEGLIYAEVFASPEHAHTSGMSYADMLEGLAAGITRAETELGVTARIIIVALRHLPAERATWAARLAADHPHPIVTGFGLAGDETQRHMRDFAPAFAIAHAAGLGCTAHAGEVCGPESVRDALDLLPVTRLGHGVRAIDDPELVARIRDQRIVLEVCPGSNLALDLYPSPDAHPLRRLHDAGCRVTLNADDPPFFATSTGAEYDLAHNSMGFSADELTQLTRNAVEAAFVDAETREALLARLA